ncbi:MAG: L-threonylcarbamoyladenylate synthase [bacterium]|nr:L-threonylcarbamoyladenylate synthase [bacterium]
MRRIHINDSHFITETVRVLELDGVIVLPTDTLYGLSALASSEVAYRRILDYKGYRAPRPFICLFDTVETAGRMVASWGCGSEKELGSIWPGPLTGIFPVDESSPAWCEESIAVRVPDVHIVRDLIATLGEPIISTSVNDVGEAPLPDVDAIAERVKGKVDLLVEGDCGNRLPSTIVDFTGTRPHVVRQGAYAFTTSRGNPSN